MSTERKELEYLQKYTPLWGVWDVDAFIGEGNYGQVFKIKRNEWGKEFVSALKLISIPQSSELKSMKTFGMSKDHLKDYYEDFVKNITNEIETMDKLKGNSHIVSYEDHRIIEKTDSFGWDILIRMELLEPLENYLESNRISIKDGLQVGIDICKALETCEIENIIHRDIKDANIFKNKNGLFKLGDFGISKELSKSGNAASSRGTPLYMAPEVFRGETYGRTVDTYSLGIVLYKLFNKGRTPYLPAYPKGLLYNDTNASIDMRMSGVPMTAPLEGNDTIHKIILKACSFEAENRYNSPKEMRQALEAALNDIKDADQILLFKEKSLEAGQASSFEQDGGGTVSIFSENEDPQEGGTEDGKDPFNKTVSLYPDKPIIKETPQEKPDSEDIIPTEPEKPIPYPEAPEVPKKSPFSNKGLVAALIVAVLGLSGGGAMWVSHNNAVAAEEAVKLKQQQAAAELKAQEESNASSTLQKAMDLIPTKLELYTADSVKLITNSKALPESSNEEKLAKAGAIETAVSKLVSKASEALKSAKGKVPKDLSLYTDETKNALEKAIKLPEDSLANMDAKAKAIVTASGKLVKKSETVKTEKAPAKTKTAPPKKTGTSDGWGS